MGDKIKTRKQLEAEYLALYGDVSKDMFERLQNFLGDEFTEDLLKTAIKRVKDVREQMTYSKIRVMFYEKPTQAHRPRANFRSRSFRTPNAAENSKAIEKLVKDIRKDLDLIVTPMKIILTAYYPMPTTAKPLDVVLFETKHQYCVEKPDFDNVLKAYCDAIQNHIILDDDLVCSSTFDKYYSIKPHVELLIIYQDNFDAEYTYKKIKARKRFKEQEYRIKAKLIKPLARKNRKGLYI